VLPQSPGDGRRLNAAAREAWERQDINTALRLQQRAFEINPNDPEIVGNLAFFYLKVKPAQPALARRLALYALGARGRAFPAGRMEDWGTFAVASSLIGRKSDAVDAMYLMLATSRNPERACRAALMAVAQYGEPMLAPANALLSRVRARGSVETARDHGPPSQETEEAESNALATLRSGLCRLDETYRGSFPPLGASGSVRLVITPQRRTACGF